MLTVPVTLEAPHELMLLSALAIDNNDVSLEDYVSTVIHETFRLHPDYRYCSSPSCGVDVAPMVVAEPMKYTAHELRRSNYTTRPVAVCPDCGAATVTLDEHLDREDCCSTWKAHMRARAAAARAFPQRRRDEPHTKGPVPRMEVRVIDPEPVQAESNPNLEGFNLPGVLKRLEEIRAAK